MDSPATPYLVTTVADGVAELIMAYGPVNALPTEGWWAVADAVRAAGADPAVRVVVLRAEGRGFNAGVDIKALHAAPDRARALVDVNRACAAAFASVYECPAPVVVAVHGYCLGGGIGLTGSADVIIASEDAVFSLPEVERGALGAATHLARLVPPAKVRAMLLLGVKATAAELHTWGSVHRVVPRAELRDAAMEVARVLASRHPAVIRAAKASLQGLDAVDPRRSYRYEQGYTFEMDLLGAGNEARAAFARGGD